MNKKLLICVLVFALVFSMAGCGSKGLKLDIKNENDGVALGEVLSEVEGNTNQAVFDYKSEKEMLGSMKKAAENDKFELYYSEDSLAVALVDKATGKAMLSNPYNAAKDSNYSGSIASLLNSQLKITYLENETNLHDVYSADDCANLGQYKINIHKNGVSFDMSIGEEKEASIIPKIITPERYTEICSNLSEDGIDFLDTYYFFYSADEFDESDVKDIYPDLKAQDIYYCSLSLSEREQINLTEVLLSAGYSKEKYVADMKAFGASDSIVSFPNFKLTLCYALTDNGVSVSIPAESIEYSPDFPLLRLSLLPYFGAEAPDKESDGYLFIPDGPGAVINLNNDDVAHRTLITGKVYGENASKLPKMTAVETTKQYYLPVFGTVKNNNTALFSVITSGDANAEITAHLGKPNGNYYATNAEFIYSDYEQYTKIGVVSNAVSNRTLYLYDKNVLKDDMTVEYYMLTGNKANYSAFANIYNEYLFGDKAATAAQSTVHIETLGSALTEKTFLGFDYDSETIFTDFEQNVDLLKKLSEDGRSDYSLSLTGWQKNGLDTSISSKIKFSSTLGGKSGIKTLADYCKENGVPLALNNNLSYVKFDRSGDNFNLKKDVTRTLELKLAENAKVSPDTLTYKNSNYVVTASSFEKYISRLHKDSIKYGIADNLGFGKVGTALNADYTEDNLINRSQAMKLAVKALENTKTYGFNFEGANAYVLPFASAVNNITFENSGLAGESATVPFLQLVLGDKVACRSEAINLMENTRDLLLSCVESGTVPTFIISYGNTSSLKVTDYTEYYAVDFKILESSVKEAYDYLKAASEARDGGAVVSHTILSEDVTYTQYENGKGVYVNRTNKAYKAGGMTIPANDYVVKE